MQPEFQPWLGWGPRSRVVVRPRYGRGEQVVTQCVASETHRRGGVAARAVASISYALSGMSITPRTAIPPPIDDPERRAARAASFEETLDDTIDQSFPASDPPSTNPAPSYPSSASSAPQPAGASWLSDPHMHLRHEGLVWAAAGALGAVASMRLLGSRRTSRLVWQLAPAAAVLAGAAFAFAQQFGKDPTEGC